MKVSVITVVYNGSGTVARAMESVIGQTYENVEYIVIDGYSTDGTRDIISKYVKNGIDIYVSEPDDGIYDAMNKGVALASGDVIAFLNSDDYYFPDAIERSIEELAQSGADLVYSNFYYANEHGYADIADEARPWNKSLLVQGIPGGHETIFAKRVCYETVGEYDLSYKSAADYEWVTRVFRAGLVGHGMSRAVLTMAPGGTSFNEGLELSENRRILESIFGALSDDLFDRLYKLKFYKNWHGCEYSDRELVECVALAAEHSSDLADAVFETIENRKVPLDGNIKPHSQGELRGRRIAIVLTYLSGIAGGAERIAIEQANELHKRGYSVSVIACHGVAGQPHYELDSAIPYIDIAIPPYKWFYEKKGREFSTAIDQWSGFDFPELDYQLTESDWAEWVQSHHMWRSRMYAGYFTTHEFDFVFSHMPSSYPYLCLFADEIKAKFPNTRLISCLHNAPRFKFYSPLYPADNDADRYMRLATLAKSDKIGILFEEFRSQMPAAFRDQCVVIPNFTLHPVREIETAARDQVVMAVGRLSPQKDHETLLRAYADLAGEFPDWRLEIYGEGPLEDSLRDVAAELSLDGDSIFKGAKRDLAGSYERASVLAFPSVFEGFGLVLVEGMAAGLPAVGFDNCEGSKNVIRSGFNGLLVDGEGDRVAALRDGLRELMSSSSKREDLGGGAYQTAAHYSLEGAIDKFEEVMTSLRPVSVEESVQELGAAMSATRKRILIVTTYTTGGAGIAALRLKDGLEAMGHEVRVLTFSPSDDPKTYTTGLTPSEYEVEKSIYPLIDASNRQNSSTLFLPGTSGVSEAHFDFMSQFDVVNLHWVTNLLPSDEFEHFERLNTPVVWTLHDMNPFTGGCHYSNGCLGYRVSCADCPQLIDTFDEYSDSVLQMKAKSWPKKIAVVSPSQWLADEAKSSLPFKRNEVHAIPNSVDLECFSPMDRSAVREALGLPKDKLLLLFSSLNNKERRKGFEELMETAEILISRQVDFHIVTLGQPNSDMDRLPVDCTSFGYSEDKRHIASIYASVDVTVLPTLEDNLPNIILESIGCGTPVAAFAAGGVPEAVIPGVTGALAPVGDCEALADAIVSLADGALRESARSEAETRFHHNVQAARYDQVFDGLIEKHKDAKPSRKRTSSKELLELKNRKVALLANAAYRQDEDVRYLKGLCDELRASEGRIEGGGALEEAFANDGEAISTKVAEIRQFSGGGFVNAQVNVSLLGEWSSDEFFFKVWHHEGQMGLEFREADGAFEHLQFDFEDHVFEDNWGRCVKLSLGRLKELAGEDGKSLSDPLKSALTQLPEVLFAKERDVDQIWARHAERVTQSLFSESSERRDAARCVGPGWYQLEEYHGEGVRWASGSAAIYQVLDEARAWTLRFSGPVSFDDQQLENAVLNVDGEQCNCSWARKDDGSWELSAEYIELEPGTVRQISLKPGWAMRGDADLRELGLLVSGFEAKKISNVLLVEIDDCPVAEAGGLTRDGKKWLGPANVFTWKIFQSGGEKTLLELSVKSRFELPKLLFWRNRRIRVSWENTSDRCRVAKLELPAPRGAESLMGELHLRSLDRVEIKIKKLDGI